MPLPADAASDYQPVGTSRLRVSVPADVGPQHAAKILGTGRAAWLGELVTPGAGPDSPARHLLNLELRVSDRAPRVAFHKAAFVDVGPLRSPDGGRHLALDISWRAAGLSPLFPVFAGTLSWTEGELRLDGHYAPPGGGVGAVADRLLLNIAAGSTGRRLLERIAEAMEAPGR